jgi:hypothetical protein
MLTPKNRKEKKNNNNNNIKIELELNAKRPNTAKPPQSKNSPLKSFSH